MTILRALRCAAAAATALLPFASSAEEAGAIAPAAPEEPVYANRISLGAGYQSADSFRFGRYTGLTKQGGLGIGELLLQGRDPWDSNGTNYWRAEGLNLGLPSRSFNLQYGNQGSYGTQFYYDGIPYYYFNKFRTIYDRSGTGALNGAPASATPWFNSAALAPFLTAQELKTQRDIFGGTADYKPPQSDWQVTTSFRHDHKEGTQEGSLVFGTGKNAVLQGTVPTGTSGNLIFFPMPIDYDIDRYDAKVAYNGQDIQAEFGYTYSGFTDNKTSFNAIDPFSSPATIPVGSSLSSPGGNNLGPPGTFIQAAYSLPPSNSAHYVKGTVGYNLTPSTRLVSTFQYGLQLQNVPYAPGTLNTFLIGKNLSSGPGSLDGQVRTLFGNATLTSQPFDKVDLKASYTIDKRDNDTARQLIQSTYTDSFQTYANAIGPSATLGVPNFVYSSDIQTARLEAGYRVRPKTKVTLGYTYKNTQRNLSDVNHQQENMALARVNSALPLGLNGNLAYEHSLRSGNYNGLIPWQYLGFTTNQNNPTAFFEAARTRDAVKGHLSASPTDEIAVGIETRAANNHYSNATFGLTNDHTISAGPDVSWTPLENLNLHTFYTYEQIFRDDAGQISITNPTGPATLGRWSQSSRDDTHTLGITGDWQVTPEFKLGASYNFAYGDVLYSLADGLTAAQSLILANQGNVIQPLPNVKSELHSVAIHGVYQFTPQVSLWVGYNFERFIYRDFALAAEANALQYGNSLYPGYTNPSYSVHVVGAALHIRF